MMAGISHSRVECQLSAIRHLESNLIDGLQHEIDEVLTETWSADIIGKQVRSLAAQSNLSSRAKAEKLVAVIRDRLKIDPKTFDFFLEILKSTSFKYLAGCLNERLCNQHRAPTTDRFGGVSLQPSISSTPKSSANSQTHHRVPSASKPSNNGEYHTRTPPRGRKKRRNSSSDSPAAHGTQSSGYGQLKQENLTRYDTDEESGFQEETKLHEPNKDIAIAGGVIGQEIHLAIDAMPQQETDSGIQPTPEGWAERSTYFVNQGAIDVINIMDREISSLNERVEDKTQKVKEMQDQMHKQEEELARYKEKLTERERELSSLQEKLKEEVQAAEDQLQQERVDHSHEIEMFEKEMKFLQRQLQEKSTEAEKLCYILYYDDLQVMTIPLSVNVH